MNWYLEKDESGQGKSDFQLYPTPGLALLYSLGISAGRGIYTISPAGTAVPRTFAVAGTTLFELNADQTTTNRGTVVNDNLPVSMVGGANFLLIASGGSSYVFNTQTNVFTTLTTGGANQLPTSVSQVAYCNGFFLGLQTNSNHWYVSAILDPTTWPNS